MKHLNKRIGVIVLICLATLFLSGCSGTKRIKVEYLPGFNADEWFSEQKPSIAVNSMWDERPYTDRIGEGYNAWGGKIETWVTDGPSPAEILEDALIRQLENAGFEVIRTSGWNFSADSIPAYLDTDFLLGGRLRTFWVESRPGLLTVSVNSRVTFDLIIADVENKRILWTGQFTGSDTTETVVRTAEQMRLSISRALTQAVNKVFQDPQVRHAAVDLVRIKF
ncbi:MAG: hypothetical protein ACOYD6_01420 [Limnochordia bacterium]